jgi:hypothetical protein
MASDKPFRIVQLDSLIRPAQIQIPATRFRLFVASDVTHVSTELLAEFAGAALKSGMLTSALGDLIANDFAVSLSNAESATIIQRHLAEATFLLATGHVRFSLDKGQIST